MFIQKDFAIQKCPLTTKVITTFYLLSLNESEHMETSVHLQCTLLYYNFPNLYAVIHVIDG